MWKKSEANDSSKGGATAPTPAPPVAPVRIARIGGSLSIQGDLYGEEDLFIEGRIEGKITVKKGSVTIGEKGRVHADIKATNIQVAGQVEGDLTGREQVVLLETDACTVISRRRALPSKMERSSRAASTWNPRAATRSRKRAEPFPANPTARPRDFENHEITFWWIHPGVFGKEPPQT